MARLSISQVETDQFDQVQNEDRKSTSKSDGKSARKAVSKAVSDSSSDTVGDSNRVSTSSRNLSSGSSTVRKSSEMANIGFEMSFTVKIDTKYPTKPGASC